MARVPLRFVHSLFADPFYISTLFFSSPQNFIWEQSEKKTETLNTTFVDGWASLVGYQARDHQFFSLELLGFTRQESSNFLP